MHGETMKNLYLFIYSVIVYLFIHSFIYQLIN